MDVNIDERLAHQDRHTTGGKVLPRDRHAPPGVTGGDRRAGEESARRVSTSENGPSNGFTWPGLKSAALGLVARPLLVALRRAAQHNVPTVDLRTIRTSPVKQENTMEIQLAAPPASTT